MTDQTMRHQFEQWASAPPYELSIRRYATDDVYAPWPGQYVEYKTQLAWEAWQVAQKLTLCAPPYIQPSRIVR